MGITNEQIRRLRDEAVDAGDFPMVTTCEWALEGDEDARAECADCLCLGEDS